MSGTSVLLVLLLAGPVALAVLTGLGARRRGRSPVVAVVAGVCWPVTWVVWYVLDERPWSDGRSDVPAPPERVARR